MVSPITRIRHLEAERLAQDIREAFGHLSPPLPSATAYDASGYHLECSQVAAKLGGRRWQDLGASDLEGEADALSFLSAEGFRYYLPAFMMVTLQDPSSADLIPHGILSSFGVPEGAECWQDVLSRLSSDGPQRPRIPLSVARELVPSTIPQAEAWRADRLALLTGEQKHVIGRFFQFLHRHHGDEFTSEEIAAALHGLHGKQGTG